MRIPGFPKIVQQASREFALKDSTVVIDAQNFFYHTYENSDCQFVFGCESDRYARYLRNYLSMFKKANVQCYFIFKGGHENFEKELGRRKKAKEEKGFRGLDFVVGENYDYIIMPIGMRKVYQQVLDEMDFDYTICEVESKKECIALAKALGCAVMSNDIEFCFSGVNYIPYRTLAFNECTQSIHCKQFQLGSFLRNFRVTEDKLSIFIALTDQKQLPEICKYQETLMRAYRIRGYEELLKWLGRQRSNEAALDFLVSRVIPRDDRQKFLEVEFESRNIVKPENELGVPSMYLMNRNTFEVTRRDPLWFEKGVAAKHIAIPYVNLVRNATIFGSWSIQDANCDDAILLSMELIIYAYNLMSNYKHTEIKFVTHGGNDAKPIKIDQSIPKPDYTAVESVFENGWQDIKSLGLFEHFLEHALPDFNYSSLEKVPEDARLLMIALIYFSAKKIHKETDNIVYSTLLSYVALSVISERRNDGNNNDDTQASQSVLPTATKGTILQEDVNKAAEIVQKYHRTVTATEAKDIFDRKLNHVLMEFQHCLDNFNFLNKLCGSPYTPTVYCKTYNGTFVYKVLREILTENGGNGLLFVSEKLKPAPTVLAFLNTLVNFYTYSM